ncbi:flagellar assembly protein T N-terminal domain-containing protein [Deinococcus sp. MIMF12]|uniref:Flagellar assembly protein T N-terminal domain-containing protein n=1 Tax=Deinococcus rhizophilus TaxID=3049544 RepID=A0ABT7JG10_9DEIO|nr:flagellar assembly protein T N-terminal domain-containing protein [Deinococcus rhizophilus]MDL2342878.1 flagellar assembly protein T N-terminal domain-containing protein [Deinococcus rhizophilus]
MALALVLPALPPLSFGSVALAATQTEQSVQVQGQAPFTGNVAAARQAAINDAVRTAIEQVLGAYISTSSTLRSTDEFEQFQQRLMKRSDGFGRVTQVLAEGQQGSLYTVTVRVVVARPSLEQELKVFLAQKGDPRIIVAIPEEILRRVVPDPAAETEVQRALIAAGYRVVDLKQTELNALRDVLRGGSLSSQALGDLATRFKADLLITGEAFAEEYGTVLSQRAYTSRLELKIVDLATGQIIFSDAFTGTGTAPTDAVAGKAALQNVAKTAVPALPGALLGWLSGSGKAAGRTFSVRLVGVPSFRALNDTLASLRATAGVSAALNRHFDAAGAQVEVEYSGSPEDLAGLLEDLGLSVTGLSAGEITVSYR